MGDEIQPRVREKKKRTKSYARYGVKIRITQKYQPVLKELTKQTGLKPKEIFLQAVEEKYGICLHSTLDNTDEQ